MIRNMLMGLRAVVYPEICVVCLKSQPLSSGAVCQSCRTSLSFIQSPYCRGCGGSLDNALELCGECLRFTRPWRHALSLFNFSGTTRELVHRFKYHGDVALTRLWSTEMRAVLSARSAEPDYDLITAVPLHWLKKMKRGYNQAELIAREFSAVSGIPFVPILKRRKWTRPQASLNLTQRQANLKNSFVLKTNLIIENKSILLIDDVFTTGSTLTACANVLAAAGASAVEVFTIARG